MAAKRKKGFCEGYRTFWDVLADLIKTQQGRLLAGDFNMSVWMVATELRERGIECTTGAWYAWRSHSNGKVMCDSCGIFFCGPVQSTRVLLGPEILMTAMIRN